MVGGLIVLAVVLAVTSAAGFAIRRRQSRFLVPRAHGRAGGGAGDSAEPPGIVLSAADLGAPLGAQATLVQFSTEVCAYCGPTREVLTEAARERDGVKFVEVDAAKRMDLTRRLHVLATPTVLVLDAFGGVRSRASGPVRKAELAQALGKVLADGGKAP